MIDAEFAVTSPESCPEPKATTETPSDPVESKQDDEGRPPRRDPFPRYMEEADQLLELRQSEGRVASLDALRGMFLDDEAEHIREHGTPEEQALLDQLIRGVDERVDDVCPISTKIEE